MKKSLLVLSLMLSVSSFANAGSASNDSCDDDSTIGMKMCIGSKLDVADAQLNKVYKQLLASAQQRDKSGADYGVSKNEVTNRLKAAQRAWITLRDADCSLQSVDMLGGTGEGLTYLSCLLEKTVQRTQDLEKVKEYL